VVGLKDVFAAEELVTSVTGGELERSIASEDCRPLEESSTAVAVRNATFVWPYERHSVDVNGDSAGLVTVLVPLVHRYCL